MDQPEVVLETRYARNVRHANRMADTDAEQVAKLAAEFMVSGVRHDMKRHVFTYFQTKTIWRAWDPDIDDERFEELMQLVEAFRAQGS
jgi:hypothetical protein